MPYSFYKNKHIVVTGGAGFIGHQLTNRLIQLGAITTVIDNLSTGDINNILRVYKINNIQYKKTSWGYTTDVGHKCYITDIQNYNKTRQIVDGNQIIFHLAAVIGGRGYIDTHPADCSDNFLINQNMIKIAHETQVDRIQFASSACVYPSDLQSSYKSTYLLKEGDAFKNNWGNADREYGWSKLMGELSLKAYYQQYGLKSSITRYVTAYGPWENDTHAIIALIRRAVEHKDPYVIWGTGKQDRDFTYIDDIVSGTLAACEHITNADTINLGTSKRYTMVETVNIIFDIIGWQPKRLLFDKTKPEGVKTRALSIKKAKQLCHWAPSYDLRHGLIKTIEWFINEKPRSVETIR